MGTVKNKYNVITLCGSIKFKNEFLKVQEELTFKIRGKNMKKIIIIGSPGAGKSVFSKKLQHITKLPLYHLDMLYHKKDGTHISKEELEEKLKNIFLEENWIIDGNYQKTIELRLKECDTVFLLDFSTDVCIAGAEARLGRKRDDLPWIEEKLEEDFKKTIINFSKEKLPQIYMLLDKYKNSKDIIILKNRKAADTYIRKLANKYNCGN